MQRTLAIVLIPALVLSSLPARAQTAEADWSRVKSVPMGTPLIVTSSTESPTAPRYFLRADDTALVLLDLTGAAMPAKGIRFLTELFRDHPEYLASENIELHADDYRLNSDGLFYRGVHLAGRDEFIRTIRKDDVMEVVKPPKGASGSIVAAAVAGGIFLGLALGVGFLFAQCGGSCAGNEVMAVGSMVGAPLGIGFAAAQATRRKAETLYRAEPENAAAVVDGSMIEVASARPIASAMVRTPASGR